MGDRRNERAIIAPKPVPQSKPPPNAGIGARTRCERRNAMTLTKTKLITAAELLRLYSKGVRGELIRGELYETMPSGQEHGEIAMQIGHLLLNFVRPRRLGRVMGSDAGVWLERDPDTVREPDVAFFAADKMPTGETVSGYAEAVPNLVVEIASPRNSAREVRDKAQMWLSFGVRIVWVVYPASRAVELHTADGGRRMLAESDTLDGGDVLPGFSCRVGDIFDVY